FINRDDGRTVARRRVGSGPLASPPLLLEDGRLLVQSTNGDLELLSVR
ncbi:MAG: outer membrane protein assembly factor BamB, partial [Limnobacter sp.]|nr:outer membrane protein assembly factor BamB [Limnobacter sp.]